MNLPKAKWLVSGVVILATIAAVGGVNPLVQGEEDCSSRLDSAARLARANNNFGFRLLNELMRDTPEENVFISPLSIHLALQMAYIGARGETKSQIAEVLSLTDLKKEEAAQYSRRLLARLNGLSGEIDFSVANSIWTRKGLSFKEEFLSMNKEYYEAKVKELDFGSSQAVKRINDWVSRETRGRIKKIVNRLTPSDIMVLINAIYFQGSWKEKFEEDNTRKQPFFLPDGLKELRLMRKKDRFYYLEKENFQLIRLPYGEEGKLVAYVALPRKEYGLEKLVAGLSWEEWKSWIPQMKRTEGLLALPRFKLRYEKTLNEPLKQLGMRLAFDRQRADLTGIIDVLGQNAYLGKVNHKTFLQVEEESTEVAAVTGVKVGATSAAPQQEPFEMIVDHPFLFAIADEKTGTLLFVGGIWEPERIEGAE